MIKVAQILKIRHMPCFAHSLNLVIKDVLTEPNVKELIDKCSSIVSHFKRSTLASDKLKSIQRDIKKPEMKLIKYIEIRWNSAYFMLKRIMAVKEELTLAISQLSNAPSNLSADEYIFLGELVKLLDPFDTCTAAVSGDKYVTISLIIPLIKGLCLKMVEFETDNFTEAAHIVIQHMKTAINDKLKPFESRSACIIATLLNPHFKKVGFKTDADVERAISYVHKEYSSYLSSRQILRASAIESTATGDSSLENDSDTPKKSKLDSLLSFVDAHQNREIHSVTADTIIDVRQYLAKPLLPRTEYPIEYWTFNENSLKHVALKYLCIPGSSTPAERIFSKAGQVVTDRRNRLSSKHINALLFLNVNYNLLKK
ncbi:zinc finger BED domain-containing protein 4-like [Anticarsia gemmatalis]|uniref:zinc finger BED domain-containing protein 4-like n=1 Tax=Anticarsia gemmatalis TaxID=129554 RepID=UPI003F7713C4